MSPVLRNGLRAAALVGLALVLLPSILFYGAAEFPVFGKGLMLGGTISWFAFAYFGFRRSPSAAELDEEHTPVA